VLAAAHIQKTAECDEVVDYYAHPEVLFDSRLYVWLPYVEGGRGKEEYVDGEFYYARVDGYANRKWEVTFEHDKSSHALSLGSVLSSLKP